MKILGIETSCDETAVAIVDDRKNILSHVLKSQVELHQKFGGVIPELAARGHVEVLDQMILEALKQAQLDFKDIDGFAATSGPGLIGGVIVGMMAAKTLAAVFKKPFLAVNHLEGHALTARLTSDLEFPYLLLLVSGGHCQILLAQGVGNYRYFGGTIDDALGEAFDKVAKMLGLPYPGGPEVEKMAASGNENRFKFPRPLIDNAVDDKHRYNFSFSGLKTAVRREIEKLTGGIFDSQQSIQKLTQQDKHDICASFQLVVSEIILNRLENVVNSLSIPNLSSRRMPGSATSTLRTLLTKDTKTVGKDPGIRRDDKVESGMICNKLVIAGGVAANRYLFSKIQQWSMNHNLQVVTPPIALCTDNAAMIAWVGVEKLQGGMIDDLGFKPKARWSLNEDVV